MDYKIELAKQMSRLPSLLQDVRVLLSQLSYSQVIDNRVWQETHRWTLTLESSFQAMALELQLSQPADDLDNSELETVNT